MSRKRLVREYTPDFAAGNYKPGDAKMKNHGGKSVASGSVGRIPYDADSELTSNGEQWPRKHKATTGMRFVDDDGVDGDDAGGHASSVGEPRDGHTKPVNHNWPKGPKNTGGTTAMKGERYSDGGVLGSSSRNVEESWSPSKISNLLGEDQNLQSIFNSYAKSRKWVSLDTFREFCEASGFQAKLDESSMLGLMGANRDFVFYEGSDSEGTYWTPLVEDIGDDEFDDMDDDADYGDDMDDLDADGLDDEVDADFDGELTDEEHSELHDKIQDFCEKYGCPEEELHALCHEYAQKPMDEVDSEDFGDMDDELEEIGGEEVEDFGDDEDMDDFGDEEGDDFGDDSMDESMDECWGEESDDSCCPSCKCEPCRCRGGMHESRRPRKTIKESRRRK